VDTPDVLPFGGWGPTTCGCETEAVAIAEQIVAAAVAAYNQHGYLCASAVSVPYAVLPAKKYQPSLASQQDFNTGDAVTGWVCMGFTYTSPIHCQYRYTALGVGNYVGWTVGGPIPGPEGFEVAVQGDSDGDYIYSTYTITGTVDPTTKQIVLTPLFTHQPLE